MDQWALVIAILLILLAYEIKVTIEWRVQSDRLARSVHATLRENWFEAVSNQAGSEILAVQTLRNSLMSSTMVASTVALGLMGALTLASPALHNSVSNSTIGLPVMTPRLVMELLVITLLFASLIASIMAVRFYNHASFVGGMPVGSDARKKWAAAGVVYVRKAGNFYSWALRQLILTVPAASAVLHPVAGLVAAIIAVLALLSVDRIQVETQG